MRVCRHDMSENVGFNGQSKSKAPQCCSGGSAHVAKKQQVAEMHQRPQSTVASTSLESRSLTQQVGGRTELKGNAVGERMRC